MTHRIGNRVVLAKEEDDICELCGKVAETRPYGPNGERICFECGMKDEATTTAKCAEVLFGINLTKEIH